VLDGRAGSSRAERREGAPVGTAPPLDWWRREEGEGHPPNPDPPLLEILSEREAVEHAVGEGAPGHGRSICRIQELGLPPPRAVDEGVVGSAPLWRRAPSWRSAPPWRQPVGRRGRQ
jgi:hypothetical protein